jgi:hypothetical protein
MAEDPRSKAAMLYFDSLCTFSFSMLSCNREDGRKYERGMRNSWKANSQPK